MILLLLLLLLLMRLYRRQAETAEQRTDDSESIERMKGISGLAGMAGAPAPAFPGPQDVGVAVQMLAENPIKETAPGGAVCGYQLPGLFDRPFLWRSSKHARVQVYASNVRIGTRLVQIAGGLHR